MNVASRAPPVSRFYSTGLKLEKAEEDPPFSFHVGDRTSPRLRLVQSIGLLLNRCGAVDANWLSRERRLAMPISWINPEELVEFEFVQAEEEGRDVARFIQEWDEHRRSTDDVAQLRRKAESLMDQMAAAAPDSDTSEPSESSWYMCGICGIKDGVLSGSVTFPNCATVSSAVGWVGLLAAFWASPWRDDLGNSSAKYCNQAETGRWTITSPAAVCQRLYCKRLGGIRRGRCHCAKAFNACQKTMI